MLRPLLRMLSAQTLALLLTASISAQSMQPAPEFAVASVKPTPASNGGHLITDYCRPDGSFIAVGTPAMWVLEYAFARRDYSVSGAPAWLNDFSSSYDIEARADGKADKDQCREMLRNLLVERFHLVTHQEQRVTSVYFLQIAKSGSKLKHGGGVRLNHSVEYGDNGPAYPDGWTMTKLAQVIADRVGRPVIDKTELSGAYGITLDFSRQDGDGLPDLVTAVQEQLGLKLVSGKAPIDTLVIDHIQKPDPN